MTEDDRYGTLTMNDTSAVLTFRRRMPFPIERVWAALTDPDERAAWMGPGTLDPREGGELTTEPTDPPAPPEAKRLTGRILTWRPPEDGRAVFEHEWRQRIVEDSVVRYELVAEGRQPVLTLTHRGLSERNALGFLPGTHAFLDRMDAHLASAALPDWGARYAEVASAYPAWR